jgi:hypothetical protein
VVNIGRGLLAVRVCDVDSFRNAHRFEEESAGTRERLEPLRVQLVRVVEGFDENLAQELGHVEMVHQAGNASDPSGGGATFAAGGGKGIGVGRVVEETDVTVR